VVATLFGLPSTSTPGEFFSPDVRVFNARTLGLDDQTYESLLTGEDLKQAIVDRVHRDNPGVSCDLMMDLIAHALRCAGF